MPLMPTFTYPYINCLVPTVISYRSFLRGPNTNLPNMPKSPATSWGILGLDSHPKSCPIDYFHDGKHPHTVDGASQNGRFESCL